MNPPSVSITFISFLRQLRRYNFTYIHIPGGYYLVKNFWNRPYPLVKFYGVLVNPILYNYAIELQICTSFSFETVRILKMAA